MLSPLASLGVATLCCYIPTVLASVLLCLRLRKTPIPVIWMLLPLVCISKFTYNVRDLRHLLTPCLVRIAGAVLSFLVPNRNAGLEAAAYAILSAGGLPLILITILLLSLV